MADLELPHPERICTKCGAAKPATREFFSKKRGGLNTQCKACICELGKSRWASPEYRAREMAKRKIRYADPAFQEKERRRQDKRNADPVHLAKEAARQKRRNADPVHRQKELERGLRRREQEEYRAKVRAFARKWYAANRIKRLELGRTWYSENRAKVRAKRSSPTAREKNKRWNRRHLQKNPHLKLVRNVGVAIAEILKAGSVRGGFRFLPYSKYELREHLQRQFEHGMSWQNYGTEWHLDHIVPQSSFKNIDVSDPASCREFQACWALANLRPLWRHDNQVKSGKRIHLL